MSDLNQFLIKFPSSKKFYPLNEKNTQKEKNSEISEISCDLQVSETQNQNDRSSFASKIGFNNKKNSSFHMKSENNDNKTSNISKKYDELQNEKFLKKIQLLEEENCYLQKVNNFSTQNHGESDELKKKILSFNKELNEKNRIIESLNNDVYQMKEKCQNEYILEKKISQMSTNEEKNNENSATPRGTLKITELMNDNKNLSYVIKELSEKYNKILTKLKIIESEKKVLELKLQEKNNSNTKQNGLKEKLQRLFYELLPHLSSKTISDDELYIFFEECAKSKQEKNYLQINGSSNKKNSEQSLASKQSSEEQFYKNFEGMKEKGLSSINDINPALLLKEIKNQKFKYSSKENFYLRKTGNTTNINNGSNLKLYTHQKSTSKISINNHK